MSRFVVLSLILLGAGGWGGGGQGIQGFGFSARGTFGAGVVVLRSIGLGCARGFPMLTYPGIAVESGYNAFAHVPSLQC